MDLMELKGRGRLVRKQVCQTTSLWISCIDLQILFFVCYYGLIWNWLFYCQFMSISSNRSSETRLFMFMVLFYCGLIPVCKNVKWKMDADGQIVWLRLHKITFAAWPSSKAMFTWSGIILQRSEVFISLLIWKNIVKKAWKFPLK